MGATFVKTSVPRISSECRERLDALDFALVCFFRDLFVECLLAFWFVCALFWIGLLLVHVKEKVFMVMDLV